jgi:hypothetical protein
MVLLVAAVAGCAGASTSATRPTATASTPAQTLTRLAQAAAGSVPVSITLAAASQPSAVTVTATLAGDVPRTPEEIAASQERVKAVIFAAQRALWRGDVSEPGGVRPATVTVSVLGPLLDDYFDRVTDWYGGATLTAGTETKLDWNALTADSAWSQYGSVWLRPYYAPFQDWGAPTPTPSQP